MAHPIEAAIEQHIAEERVQQRQKHRREIAAQVLAGICASSPGSQQTNEFLAGEAVRLADALLAELERTAPK